MSALADTLILSCAIGLTGALAPGPTLVATVGAAVAHGWTAGPRVTAGHMAVEAGIFLLILSGAAYGAAEHTGAIACIGGAALLGFGAMTVRESRTAVIATAGSGLSGSPVFAGALTSASNPYFWLWWITIGSALLLQASEAGIAIAVAFMAGHWAADMGWFTVVASVIARGGTVLSDRTYRMLLAACGLFLAAFGIWYMASAFA
ncbi:MAG: LysE family transporter [Methanomicrobiales archaeon]|nr:LysE family transporter [Methanomicrobiales archaeon]